jgi:uncharacterized membrane protein YidH (DUF202 family)
VCTDKVLFSFGEFVLLKGPEKYKALQELSAQYGCGWIEFNENISQPLPLLLRLDLEKLKQEAWFPYSFDNGRATVIACRPCPEIAERAKKVLGVTAVDFLVTLPADLVRIIEHNQDANPGFPPLSGRTPLARVRTYLGGRRSLLAHYRTLLAKSRTGLAFIRTGISCIAIALLFLRIFGAGWLLFLEGSLLVAGCIMAFDGIKWYLPARQLKTRVPTCTDTGATGGTTVLAVSSEKDFPLFIRSSEVVGARELRNGWSSLSPVMRRRFLASDRTDYAEERTLLACFRTRMAKARTGLAFVRTGVAFVSLGLALIRLFYPSRWMILDFSLIGIGTLMVTEGFLWYLSGRQGGVAGNLSVKQRFRTDTIWDFFFPHRYFQSGPESLSLQLPVHRSDLPGIWATTGLALERTVLAERRNVMARLRTVMARSRTGLAFIRTGLSLSLIGVAFVLYFGPGSISWNIFNWLMITCGLLLIGDGLYWSLPAERLRREFPYCYGDMEIMIPDYGVPARRWQKVVFSHE